MFISCHKEIIAIHKLVKLIIDSMGEGKSKWNVKIVIGTLMQQLNAVSVMGRNLATRNSLYALSMNLRINLNGA